MLVNLESLPSIPLEQKSSLPICSGIYFVIDEDEKVLYVGRSKNINQRWSNAGHHKYTQLSSIPNVRIAWLEVSDASLLPNIEAALIDWFCPTLNRPVTTKQKLEKTRLEVLREKAGLTQRQVAAAIGVTVQTISNWETGFRRPKLYLEQLYSLCETLSCTLGELTGKE
jgi:DNA-binding XRE family transcriptional regulator